MKTLGKIIFGVVALVLVVVVVELMAHKSVSARPPKQLGSSPSVVDPDTIPAGSKIVPDPSSPSTIPDHDPSASPKPVSEYHESDEVMEPYKLSKNPYQWRGHSGILEMRMPVIASNGVFVSVVPLAGLKFRKMISEHIAVYEVMVSNEESGDELAVILPNSEPPDVTRPWRILVDGPLEATTSMDTPLTITAVRFEGYYSTPKPPIADQQSPPN